MISQKEKDKAVMEKRKHIRITSLCNNKCVFCLAGDKKGFMKDVDDLKKELVDGLNEGCERLILSGGEPTINKNIIKITKFAKKIGYKKIQIISNGRMWAYPSFTKEMVKSGIDEVTFSMHSHIPEVYDTLTGVKGSFKQAITGLKNVLKSKLIVSVDIVINALNVKKLKETIEFYHNMGVNEFDLLMITPFGYAFENKGKLFFNIESEMPHIISAFNYAEKEKIVVWTNRFPAKYLENYEDLIQDSNKIYDEVKGREKSFKDFIKSGKIISCMGERCKLCYMLPYCAKLKELLEPAKKKILANEEKNILTLNPPKGTVSEYLKDAITPEEIKHKIKNKKGVKNIPKCIAGENIKIIKNYWGHNSLMWENDVLDLNKFTQEFISNYKVKKIDCEKCKYYEECEGIFQHYIKIYGFKILKPIKK